VPLLKDAVGLGIALPQTFPGSDIDVAAIAHITRRAEELGFDEVWSQEALLTLYSSLDGLELLGYAAAISSNVRLGIATLVLPRHHPVLLAKRLTTLDHLSAGRLVVGVSLGGGHEYFAGAAMPSDRPVLRFLEALSAINAVWASTRPSHQGELWQIQNVSIAPLPLQRPRPPVWIGAGHPAALNRAARHGDGWIGAGASTAADFARAAKLVREQLYALGRDPQHFPLSKRVYLAIDDDAARAEQRLAERLTGIYGAFAPGTEAAVVGPPERVLEALWQLVEAGATHLLLNPLYDERQQLEAAAELAGLRPG
jgi:alkanesulfonate monooxygenase SsuD/methylene tetrahydromethanopterin reductase-like flavin-dependent oxidoreductase (luciferase family)